MRIAHPPQKAVAVAAGQYHSLAHLGDGEVVAWMSIEGWDNDGQCNIPANVQHQAVTIAAGDSHSLALLRDGGVAAWGRNWYKQCDVPASVQQQAVAVSCGPNHGPTS